MARVVSKSKASELRRLIKYFKKNADDLDDLRSKTHLLLMAIRLSEDPRDAHWRAEGLHQVALFHMHDTDWQKSEKYFIESLHTFGKDEPHGLGRALRDYALLYASAGELTTALLYARLALALHNEDLAIYDEAGDSRGVAKAKRQKKLSQCYLWHLQLESPMSDTEVLDKLMDFALNECQDCCPRDQVQVAKFAMAHAPSSYRQRLRLHLGLMYATRLQPVAFTGNLIRFGLDMPRFTTGYTYRLLFRKE